MSSVFYNSTSGANIALVGMEEKRVVFFINFTSFSQTDYPLSAQPIFHSNTP